MNSCRGSVRLAISDGGCLQSTLSDTVSTVPPHTVAVATCAPAARALRGNG